MLRECERAKREKNVLNGATRIPLVMTTLGKLGPSAEKYLQNSADVACSTGFVDLGVWLQIAKQLLSCALDVALRFVTTTRAFRSAGKDVRDGAVVPFE